MNAQLLAIGMLAVGLAACSGKEPDAATANPASDGRANSMHSANPILAEWNTPFAVPPFDLIRSEHYLPALRVGMQQQNEEIATLVANPEPASFSNTIETLERSGSLLRRVSRVFFAVNSAHSDDIIKDTAKTVAPELSAHSDDIMLNAELFQRVDDVYRQRASLPINGEQTRLLEETYKEFVRSGAGLDFSAKARLRAINSQLAKLSNQFNENLLEETNNFELLVTERAALGDLPKNLVALAAQRARDNGHECECWSFSLQRPSINPFLQYSPDRDARKFLFDGYAMRANNGNAYDNKQIVSQIVELRAERALLLGYENHADYVLAERMAENTDRVNALLDQIWPLALRAASEERSARQLMMYDDGVAGKLERWDWRYYTEKVRKAKYDFDEEALRPYFEVNAVRDGVFELSTRLFGLTFERRDDIAGWHPQQQVFEVFDADGSHLAILYMDFFARESKRAGAWMGTLRQQSNVDGLVTPIVTTNFNFPAPTEDSPALLSLTEAETLFHEFGHALHGMLSDVTYESFAGTSTPRDFVEFPSQVLENWMKEPAVLRMFAKHYRTGEDIPDDIIDKITASARFDQGFKTVEYMAAAYLDIAYHMLDDAKGLKPNRFENTVMADIGLLEQIIPRYRSTYFRHIFAGGYSAGYYSYLWSEVLDADAFQAFKETSLLSRETAARFREHILSKGGTRPGMELYENFRGRPPKIEALLQRRGFLDSAGG